MTNFDLDIAEAAGDQPTPSRRRAWIVGGAAVGAAAVIVIALVVTFGVTAPGNATSEAEAALEVGVAVPIEGEPIAVPEITEAELAALTPAVYDAVIPGLLAYTGTDTTGITNTYTSAVDVPVFGDDRTTPVAKLPALNFLEEQTVIVPVVVDGDWALVLTPSRQTEPSKSAGNAPAQTSGWIPRASLTEAGEVTARVTISVSQQTLTILNSGETTEFSVGVGAADTPTPTGTTGYIQARYEDAYQGPLTIQLTTLHSSAADEPFGGSDGGLIGMHYNTTSTGEVSHGCIRLAYDAITAVNALPLGTPVVITD